MAGDPRNITIVKQPKDMIFEKQTDVELVLRAMRAMLSNYGIVTLADLNDLVGLSHESTHEDHKWGWINLEHATITMAAEKEWRVKFPEVIRL